MLYILVVSDENHKYLCIPKDKLYILFVSLLEKKNITGGKLFIDIINIF